MKKTIKKTEEIIKIISSQCKPYIDELRYCPRGSILIRATNDSIIDYRKYFKRKYREPRDTDIDIHKKLNEIFSSKFGWEVRIGTFCFGTNIINSELDYSYDYGQYYLMFPVNSFRIVYSEVIFDLYKNLKMNSDYSLQEFVDNNKYRNDSLCNAIKTINPENIKLSNEISICSNEYYLIDLAYKEDIVNYVWCTK